jgi:hypothetical protein
MFTRLAQGRRVFMASFEWLLGVENQWSRLTSR